MRRLYLVMLLVFLAVLTVGCGGLLGGEETGNTAVPTVGLVGSALDWDRNPDRVIVQLDTTGSVSDPADLNNIPFCTIFGDGYIVWTNPATSPEQVLQASLDDQRIRGFLEFIIGSGFYGWDSQSGFRVPTPADAPGPIVETITLTLYGSTHTIDAFSNWPPGAFDRILERCRSLASSPAIFVPDGAWVSMVPVQASSSIPSIPWNAYAEAYPEVDPAAMTLENPQWYTGELLQLFWQITREGRHQVTNGGNAYRVVVQVPRIMPDAPLAPGAPTPLPPTETPAET